MQATKKMQIKKTKLNAPTKDAERMRQIVSGSWKAFDAALNNFRKTHRSDTSLLYKAIRLPVEIRNAKRGSTYIWGTFFTPYKKRPDNSRKNNRSKGSALVSNIKHNKARSDKNRPIVLPKGFGKSKPTKMKWF
mgnify:CR=1 FL=1